MESNIKATVFNIQKYSIHDGEGIRTLVFLKGCPLDCWWCSNPESQQKKPELIYTQEKCLACNSCLDNCLGKAITKEGTEKFRIDYDKCISCGNCKEFCYAEAISLVGEEFDVPKLVAQIKKDIPFYRNSRGGVTFSGGEPLLYPDFINSVVKECDLLGISVAIETCGYVPQKNLFCILENDNLDTVMFDLKLMDPQKHHEFCGAVNNLILRNFELLNATGNQDIIVRIPIIPGINDSVANISSIAEFVKDKGVKVKRVDLLPYHDLALAKYSRMGRDYKLKDLRPPTTADLNKLKALIESYKLNVQIGG